MHSIYSKYLPMLLSCMVLFCGCVPEEVAAPPAPQDPPAAAPAVDTALLVQAWKELAKTPIAEIDEKGMREATFIVQQLVSYGPEALDPIFDVLGDPEASPDAKVLVVISLTPHIRPELAPRLIALTAETLETTTRSSAAHLLSLLDTPEANTRLRELMHDKARHTRIATFLALLPRADEEALSLVDAVWADEAGNARERTQLVLALPEQVAADHLPIFAAAIVDPALEEEARMRAVKMLGRYGDLASVTPLRQCAAKDPNIDIRAMAQRSLEALEARFGAAESSGK